MNFRSLWFSLLLLFPNLLWANDILDSFLKDLRTLQAQFEQKLKSEKGDLLETSRGQMFLQRPNKFRWDYQQPFKQLIVADGDKVWVYDHDLDQVTIKNLKTALGSTPALLLSSDNTKIEQEFFVNPLPSQPGINRFELVPKDAQAQFTSIRLNLQGKKLQTFEFTDNLGQTSVITFSQAKYNEAVDPDLFIFTPPAGADVVQDK
jgi:outer membrane lipoprotein carrier protein